MTALRGLLLAAAASSTTACGTSDPVPIRSNPLDSGVPAVVVTVDCPVKPPDPSRVRVLVVDHGFDVRHPIFDGKIAGCYRIECPGAGSNFATRPGETDDEAAARMASSLLTPTPECTVRSGMKVVVDSYLENFPPSARAEWNDAILGKHQVPPSSNLDGKSLLSHLNGIDGAPGGALAPDAVMNRYIYHGTASAGAVAYDNDVDLVLVDRLLGDASSTNRAIACLSPSEVAIQVRLLHRAEVIDAYVHAPFSGMEAALRDLRRQHAVSLENQSFGPLATQSLEETLARSGCPFVNLRTYTQTLAELDAKRDAFLRTSGVFDGADPLIFEAGGNDGLSIASGADDLSCTPDRQNRLLVGSYGLYRGQAALSNFSNDGDCIDLYALGENVVVPAPAGFYVPLSGTSFAAPLALRFASQLAKSTRGLGTLRELVLGARDVDRFLPVSTMPVELAFFGVTQISAPTPKPLGQRLPALLGQRGVLDDLRGMHR